MSNPYFIYISLIISIFCGTSTSRAGTFDHSASFAGRTTPIAGQFEAVSGFGQMLWGEGRSVSPWFGYVRPSIALRGPASPTGVLSLDIFPISFLGLTFGRIYSQRWIDNPGMNCEQAQCRGSLNQNFVRGRLFGKMGNIFAALTFEKTIYDDHTNINKPIGQGTNMVYLDPVGEKANEWFLTLGYGLNEDWSLGLTAQDYRTLLSENRQESQMLFLRLKRNNWSYALAAGRFQSSQFNAAPEFSLLVNWIGSPSIGY